MTTPSHHHHHQKYLFLTLIAITLVILIFKSVPKYTANFSLNKSVDSDHILIPMIDVMSGDPIKLNQDDPRIKKFIWDHGYLIEPSKKPYNLKPSPNEDPSMGQGQFIRKIFNNMRDGFFVESGALDGQTRSNTLYLEKNLGWQGLLIEADPSNYELVLDKNRKSWTSNTCLATKSFPHKVLFHQQFNTGRITANNSNLVNKKGYKIVQCFPLFSLLNALSISTVDYFSLDVEGTEMELLENIPFDKIFIKTLSVEFSHVPRGKNALKKFMEEKGYLTVKEITNSKGLANDFIFLHKTLKHLLTEGNS